MPFTKVQRTPVGTRKRLVMPAGAMSPTAKLDGNQRNLPLQTKALKFMSFENQPLDQQPFADQEGN